MSGAGAPDAPALAATDLLALDERQIAECLNRNSGADGQYDISGLAGVRRLSKSQRGELARKLRAAASQPETSPSLKIDELLTRLASVANEQDGSQQDGSQSPDRGLLRPLGSIEGTPPPVAIQPTDSEVACYQGLIEDGGRPVCSIQDLSHLLASPTASRKAVLPWLSNHPYAEDGTGEIKTVFSRQFEQWWDFRKSQWHNRGVGESEEGFSAFLESSRRRWEHIGAHEMVSNPGFEETVRRLWQHKPASRQLPDGQGFPAYSAAVKRRLTPYHFTRFWRLKKNPRQQTPWTDWLEYINYEQWWSEMLTEDAESLVEEHYYQPWKRLLEAPRHPSGEARGSHSTGVASNTAASGYTQTRPRRPAPRMANLAEELRAVEADLDATNKQIDDFIQETALYRRVETAAYFQRLRVKWAVREARLMETEMSKQRRTAKRQRGDDAEIPPELQPKRARRGDGGSNAVADTAPDKPPARRSKRLAELRDKASLH